MTPMNISRITENLQKLPADKLALVHDFFEFTRDLGQKVENSGLSEQDLMNELEETKREVFAEQYGELKVCPNAVKLC